MGSLFKRPKVITQSPPPPPPPVPIPTENAPDIRAAQLELERKGRKKGGRSSTMQAGALGSGRYRAPAVRKSTLG